MKCRFVYIVMVFMCNDITGFADENVVISDSWPGWPPYDSIRLPQTLRPTLYNITVRPNIYGPVEDGFTYDCKTTIYITCLESTDVIRVHSVGHTFNNITLTYLDDNGSYTTDALHEYRVDERREILEIRTVSDLRAGHEYELEIDFHGVIGEALRGFYYSPYKEDGETKYIFTTMFEPTDARRFFPNFDEPDFKAVFLFNIERKDGMKTVTNLPKRTTFGPDADGYYVDVFDEPRDVLMSSYLVAIAIGEIDYKEAKLNNIQLRTWSRKSHVHLTEYALDMEKKFMDFFENYFNISYTLPKEDMIAVPTMSFNAMEHWGLITYREESMLYEPGVSSESDKEWISVLIAHELSHQWFGNLVSPKWWDDLWLNEGFATYMMFLAVDGVIPEWNMMNKLVVDYRGVQNVFGVDATLASHPVYVPVHHPSEINEIFDIISYAKGCAVIRMMNFFLGQETFKQGLTRYLTDFSYKTATHNDLWSSLSQQAIVNNNPISDVKAIMDNWLLQKNFPVVTVTRIDASMLRLSQAAFLVDADERQNRSDIFWEIPFVFTTDKEVDFDKKSDDIVWLHKDGQDVYLKLDNVTWVVGNVQQYGYYRVNYDESNWFAILDQLKKDHTVIHPINRAQIINDAWNLVRAGLLGSNIHLQTLEYLDKETDAVPWKAALKELHVVRMALQLTPAYGDFEEFMRRKLQNAYFSSAGATSHYKKIQYSMIAEESCGYGLTACINDSMEKFNQWMNDKNVRIDPDTKDTVYCTGVLHGGKEAWDLVLEMYTKSDSSTERKFLLDALACIDQPWIIAKLMRLTISSDAFSRTDTIRALGKVASKPIGRLMVGHFLEENWTFFFERYGTGLNLFAELIKTTTAPYNTRSELQRLERLVEKHSNLGTGARVMQGAITQTKANIEWMDTYYTDLEQWLHNKL